MLPKNVSVSDVLILNCARFQLYQLYLDLQLKSNTFVASASFNVGHENKGLEENSLVRNLIFYSKCDKDPFQVIIGPKNPNEG